MRTSEATTPALTISVTFALLTGCSGGSSPIAPTALAQFPGVVSQSTQEQVAQDPRTGSIIALHRGSVSAHPVTTPSFMSADAKGKRLIFVSDSQNNVVDIMLHGTHGRERHGQPAHSRSAIFRVDLVSFPWPL